MNKKKCPCGINYVEYISIQLQPKENKRWLCQQCYDNLYYFQKTKFKNIYNKNEDLLAKFDNDLKQFKLVRENLIAHLHQLFDQYPFQQLRKSKYAQEIGQIDALFFNLQNNPFKEQDLGIFNYLKNRLQNADTFIQMAEQNIQNLLLIGTGHYQCDNSKFQEILNIMMNIDQEDIKSSHLVTSLKLIAKKPETSLIYKGQTDILFRKQFLCYFNKTLYYYESPKEWEYEFTDRIKAIKSYNHSRYFEFHLQKLGLFFLQCSSTISKYNLIVYKCKSPIRQQAYVLCIKSKKIIRSIQHSYDTIHYDQKSNQLISVQDKQLTNKLISEKQLYLIFQNLSTLKIQCKIQLEQELCNVQFSSKLNKVISLRNNKLLVLFDIDYQNSCLINCQQLNYHNILNYHINQQYNFIVLISRDNKIFILDQHLIQLKFIDWARSQKNIMNFKSQLMWTQVSDDMKYLYSCKDQLKLETRKIKVPKYKYKVLKYQVFKLSLTD